MNIPKLISALLLIMLSACTDPPPAGKKEKLMDDLSHIVCKPSVHPFWAKFREAVLKEDWNGVADLTEFPLTVHRSSPAAEKFLSRQDFAKQFPQFLNAPSGERYPRPGSSMKELVRSIPTLAKDECGDFEEQLAIGEWRFFLRSEGWRLGVVYVHEFPPSMMDIPLQPHPPAKD